ncbi:hypothetical protein LguiB_024294 [Lonicera macranthoides]
MGIDEDRRIRCFPAWGAAEKQCDYCSTAAALLFCRMDKAFMCMACDARVHGSPASGVHSRHERLWLCEVCEHAPASVTCKADAAALCVTCDRDIHAANPLARRHERVPVVPFYETAESVVKSTAAAFLVPVVGDDSSATAGGVDGGCAPEIKSVEMLFSDSDQLLDFDFPVPTTTRHQYHHHDSAASDSVVPVQPVKPILPVETVAHAPEVRFEIDFTRSNFNSYNNNYAAQSLSQSVSSSSMDVGVVPDGNSTSDISYPFALQLNSTLMDPNNSTTQSQPTQLSGLDREARVMRYREKRKNRKFEKTIRYASRKAYAETRPRVKGRFAKRTDTDNEADRWFIPNSTGCIGDSKYGVVPSF